MQCRSKLLIKLNRIKNGNLTISEIEEVGEVDPQRFQAADRDGTHALSIYEYLNALHKDFEAADTDKDGTIDLEELRNMIGK